VKTKKAASKKKVTTKKKKKVVKKKKKTSKKKKNTIQPVQQPIVKKPQVTTPVTLANVTGWASRLNVNDGEDTYAASSDAIGSAPRYVSYGNYILSNNSIGTPDPSSSINGLTHFNLAFWVSNGGNASRAGDVYTGSGNADQWALGDPKVQKAIVKEYNKYGIRLGVAAFGAFDKPQSSGNDPVALAITLAAFVRQNNLQGVDVDYEEFDYLTDWTGNGAAWLIKFITQLRASLPRPQFYISAAPVAPSFNGKQWPNGFNLVHEQVGQLIDYYNVQFYNQQGAYSSCQTLLTKSDVFLNSSVFELNTMQNVPLSMIVIGKPAHVEDAITYTDPSTNAQSPDGYMTPALESQCLQQATGMGWRAGTSWWQYKGLLSDVIRPARTAIAIKTT
jgi:hypothetical protein